MKIKIEHEGHEATVEDNDIVDVTDAIELMEQALIQIGYEPKRLEGAFLYKAKKINGEWK